MPANRLASNEYMEKRMMIVMMSNDIFNDYICDIHNDSENDSDDNNGNYNDDINHNLSIIKTYLTHVVIFSAMSISCNLIGLCFLEELCDFL